MASENGCRLSGNDIDTDACSDERSGVYVAGSRIRSKETGNELKKNTYYGDIILIRQLRKRPY